MSTNKFSKRLKNKLLMNGMSLYITDELYDKENIYSIRFLTFFKRFA